MNSVLKGKNEKCYKTYSLRKKGLEFLLKALTPPHTSSLMAVGTFSAASLRKPI